MKNKVYIPLLDIYLDETAIFDDGYIILSFDSLYYNIENTDIYIDGSLNINGIDKWLVKDNGYTYEALVPFQESGDWVYIEHKYVEIINV